MANSVGFWLTHVSSTLHANFNECFSRIGYKGPEALIILLLSIHKSIPLVKLAQKMSYAHPSVLRHIDNLEAQGIVERSPDPADRRIKQLSLTEKGQAEAPEVRKLFVEVQDSLHAHLTAEEKDFLIKTLKKLFEAISSDDDKNNIKHIINHTKL